MSGHVGSAISKSGLVENVGIRWNHIAISVRATVASTPGSVAAGLSSGCRFMSAISRPKSGIIEKVGVAVGFASPSLCVLKFFRFRFDGRHHEITWDNADFVKDEWL